VARRLTLAVNGVLDLWHRWLADGWRRRRTHRSIYRLHHGLAGSRGSRSRIRWRRRRVEHRRIGSGLAGHSQCTARDDHARDRDPRCVGGWCGALSLGHKSRLSSLGGAREDSLQEQRGSTGPDLRARLAPLCVRRHLVYAPDRHPSTASGGDGRAPSSDMPGVFFAWTRRSIEFGPRSLGPNSRGHVAESPCRCDPHASGPGCVAAR
jgi:hypothetical protein